MSKESSTKKIKILLFLITLVSAFMVWSASGGDINVLKRHLEILALACSFMVGCSIVSAEKWKLSAIYLPGVAIGLLLLLYTPLGFGRYLDVGRVIVQPAHFMYFAWIIFMGYILSEKKLNVGRFWLYACVVALITTITTDQLYPVMIILGVTYIVSYEYFGRKWLQTVIMGITISGIGLYTAMIIQEDKSFFVSRIRGWVNPQESPYEWGYHSLQKVEAIKRGGFVGQGIFKSQYMLNKTSDGIFVVICEQFGVVGSVVVLSLLALLLFEIYKTYKVFKEKGEMFETIIILGVIAHISICVIYKVFTGLNLLPECASNLPLISLCLENVLWYSEIGLVLGCAKQRIEKV